VIAFLREHEAVAKTGYLARKYGSRKRRCTTGRPSTAAWTCPRRGAFWPIADHGSNTGVGQLATEGRNSDRFFTSIRRTMPSIALTD